MGSPSWQFLIGFSNSWTDNFTFLLYSINSWKYLVPLYFWSNGWSSSFYPTSFTHSHTQRAIFCLFSFLGEKVFFFSFCPNCHKRPTNWCSSYRSPANNGSRKGNRQIGFLYNVTSHCHENTLSFLKKHQKNFKGFFPTI